jgi:hypothetical protein
MFRRRREKKMKSSSLEGQGEEKGRGDEKGREDGAVVSPCRPAKHLT